MMKRDLPGTTSLEEEEQRRNEKLPTRPEGCVQVPPAVSPLHAAEPCSDIDRAQSPPGLYAGPPCCVIAPCCWLLLIYTMELPSLPRGCSGWCAMGSALAQLLSAAAFKPSPSSPRMPSIRTCCGWCARFELRNPKPCYSSSPRRPSTGASGAGTCCGWCARGRRRLL